MQHYGDITKIRGAEVPIVDVVTGGSPCQDLSVAGKRAGLAGERSGLFMEQIRIIKEMRDEDKRLRPIRGADEYIRPRYMVWENVPGAFSSNKGEDFRAVLEETAKVVQGDACIPGPPGGKWPYAGCIMGDGWSIAWRLHDAQFWGVPQRRKRIALVADFGGATAPEILFEREGMSGDIEESRKEGQGIATDSKGCLNPASDADHVPCVYGLDRASFNQGINAQYDFQVDEEKVGTQVAQGPGAVCQSVVRRLTPLECERLQGFPDHWTDIGDWVDSKGKKHKGESDSPRYKALGNSIALPFWKWMAERMVAYLDENPTMASLFSGIGGFELVFARVGCKPVWNSEIEPYPEAVTRVHFGDDERGIKGDYEQYL